MTCPNDSVMLKMHGGSVKLSLTMGQLYVAWRRWPIVWAEFNRIVNSKKRTIDDMTRVVYAASCCAAAGEEREPRHDSIMSFRKDLPRGLDGIDAVYDAYVQLMPPESPGALRETFERRARSSNSSIRLPRFELETPVDYYVYLVVICGISEDLFWEADYSFLWDVACSKGAFDSWLAGEHERRR